MYGKVLGIAAGCFALVAGGLTVHAVAMPAPQLTLMGGTGIAPKIETGNLPGGKRAIQGARDNKAKADAKVGEANDIMSTPSSGSGQSQATLTPGQLVNEFRTNPERAAKHLVGAPVKVAGVVLKSESAQGAVEVVLGPAKANADSPVFVFRMADKGQSFQPGQSVVLEGMFAFRGLKEGFDNEAYFVNMVEEAQVAAPEAAEPPKPFGGWRFVGSVSSSAGGGTAVFVKDGETLYAHAGDLLEKDVKVVHIRAGEATLADHGVKSLVTPW